MIWPVPSSQSNLGMVCLKRIPCVIIWVDFAARAVAKSETRKHIQKKVQTSHHRETGPWCPSSHRQAPNLFFLSHLKCALDTTLHSVTGLQTRATSQLLQPPLLNTRCPPSKSKIVKRCLQKRFSTRRQIFYSIFPVKLFSTRSYRISSSKNT